MDPGWEFFWAMLFPKSFFGEKGRINNGHIISIIVISENRGKCPRMQEPWENNENTKVLKGSGKGKPGSMNRLC
jgi:hypothetical protein